MADLTDQKQFEAWLKTQPREVGIVIATRMALRTFPMITDQIPWQQFGPSGHARRDAIFTVLRTFRTLSGLVAAILYPKKYSQLYKVVENECYKLGDYADNLHADFENFSSVLYVTVNAANTLFSSEYQELVRQTMHRAAQAELLNGGGVDGIIDFQDEAERDAVIIQQGRPIADLARSSLWKFDVPRWLPDESFDSIFKIIEEDRDWDVWSRWYDAVLDGKPTPGGEELDIYRVTLDSEEDWEESPAHVNALIKAREVEINRRRGLLPGSTAQFTGNVGPPVHGNAAENASVIVVQSQTPGALRFGAQDDGPVDVVEFDGSNFVADTEDSRDRYAEVVRFAVDLVSSSENGGDTPNNANDEARREAQLLREALGQSIRTIRPGLLIPRGDALRNRLTSQINRDNLSDMPPLSEGMLVALKNLVSAYNVFVSLDDELAKRDEARLGPDAARNLVPPNEGSDVAQAAVVIGAATARAAGALLEEAKVAPSVPDPTDRRSRRYSEGVKNFSRALLARVQSLVRLVRDNPVKSMGGAAATTILAAKWALANEAWLLKFSADNPSMIEAIKTIVEFLKTLPLG